MLEISKNGFVWSYSSRYNNRKITFLIHQGTLKIIYNAQYCRLTVPVQALSWWKQMKICEVHHFLVRCLNINWQWTSARYDTGFWPYFGVWNIIGALSGLKQIQHALFLSTEITLQCCIKNLILFMRNRSFIFPAHAVLCVVIERLFRSSTFPWLHIWADTLNSARTVSLFKTSTRYVNSFKSCFRWASVQRRMGGTSLTFLVDNSSGATSLLQQTVSLPRWFCTLKTPRSLLKGPDSINDSKWTQAFLRRWFWRMAFTCIEQSSSGCENYEFWYHLCCPYLLAAKKCFSTTNRNAKAQHSVLHLIISQEVWSRR